MISLNPARALRRFRSSVIARRRFRAWYDGATRTHRTDAWRTQSSASNVEIIRDLRLLRDRARDLVRNNAYAARAVSAIVYNVIGSGVIPTVRGNKTARISKRLNDWANSTACDYQGRHDLVGLEQLAMRAIVESGEVLIRQYPIQVNKNIVPLQLQVLEGDYLDMARSDFSNTWNGIEYNDEGKRTAYWLFKRHPGDRASARTSFPSERVPAEFVAHIYRTDRPGQDRGVPWLSPVVMRIRDLADYEDAQLVRQKIAACYAIFETTMDADDSSTKPSPDLETLSPGIYQRLPPGKDIKFAEPPTVSGYNDYLRGQICAIAIALSMPYEVLSGDLSNVNFSSGRMGWIEFHRAIESWRWGMLVPQGLNPVGDWFLKAASAFHSTNDIVIDWTPPRREMIDPTKEIPAMIQAARGGLTPISESLLQLGYDPEVIFQQFADDQATFDRLKLTFDSDGRNPASGGPPPPDPVAEPPAKKVLKSD